MLGNMTEVKALPRYEQIMLIDSLELYLLMTWRHVPLIASAKCQKGCFRLMRVDATWYKDTDSWHHETHVVGISRPFIYSSFLFL